MFVSPEFFPFIGGAENLVLRFCRGLQKAGNEIVVFTSTKNAKDLNGIKVYSFPYLFRYSNTPLNFWGASLNEVVKKESPAIILGSISTPFMADSAARIAEKKNIPFFLIYLNDYIKQNFFEKILLSFYYYFFLKKTFRLSRKIIVLSDYYAKKSSVLKPFLNKTTAVSPFVDLEEFAPKNVEKPNNKNRTILFIGALNKGQNYKGLDYLLKAVFLLKEKFPLIKLVVVGKGNNLNYFKNLSENLRIKENVFFAGIVSQQQLLTFYSECETLVLPSVNNSEGFGLVLLEAMAFSKPVIGSNVGGIPAVIQHNFNGLLVEPKNEVKLSKAIAFILTNKKKAKEMGLNGLKKAKELSPEKSTKKLLKMFEDELNAKK